MKLIKQKFAKYAGYGLLLLSPFSAAHAVTFTTTQPPNITNLSQIYNFTERILAYLQTFFWIIVAIFVVLTAYKYLTSGGDEEKVKSAKQTLIYTVIAVVVALVATAIVGAVSSFLRGS